MKRRDLLKWLAGVPLVGALVPRALEAAVDNGVSLNSAAHPHSTYAMGFMVTEDAPTDEYFEDIARRRTEALKASMNQTAREYYDGPEPARIFNESHELNPDSLEYVHLVLPDHEFSLGSDLCRHCGASAQIVEEGSVPRYCAKHPRFSGGIPIRPHLGGWEYMDPWV